MAASRAISAELSFLLPFANAAWQCLQSVCSGSNARKPWPTNFIFDTGIHLQNI